MEKCTYCVQRIQPGQITADIENRRIRDGEVVTACQQACPTEAIVFGDQNDPQSRGRPPQGEPARLRDARRAQSRPRTTYEALIRNRSAALGDAAEGEHA